MSRVVIEAAVLAKAMHNAAAIVDSRNTIPILANVRLEADGDSLEIVTTDLDNEFRQRLPLTEAGQIATTVDARRLAALAAASSAGAQLSMEPDTSSRLAVKSGRSRWVIPSLQTGDFPLLPEPALAGSVTIEPGRVLAEAIERTVWSASTEITMAYLSGIYLHDRRGELALCSANKATLVAMPLGQPFPSDAPAVIMAGKFARTLARLADGDVAVQLAWDERKVRAIIGDVTLTGKTIEGSFPDYQRIIPPPRDTPILVDPAALKGAIRRVQLVATNARTRKIRVDIDDGKLALSIDDAEGGAAREELPADCTAAPMPVHFDASLMLGMIDAIGGETIEIHQATAGDPALIRRVVCDGTDGILMPMRG